MRAGAIGRFPVRYKKAMAESGFSAEYYRELVYAHVDNVNLLYVALTRAAESLHVFIPQQGRPAAVGGLLLQSIGSRRRQSAARRHRRAPHRPTEDGRTGSLSERFAGPVRRRRQSIRQRSTSYWRTTPRRAPTCGCGSPRNAISRTEDEVELSPRNLGILMHKAFEQADDDGNRSTRPCSGCGTTARCRPAKPQALRGMIARALAHPVAGEWFGGGWQRVRNENEIIVPGAGSTRRPDRVMIRGTRAVVVDYKFGKPRPRTLPPPGGRIPRPAAANGLHRMRRVPVVRETGGDRKSGRIR